MPGTTVYPTGRFNLGGRVYLRDEPMEVDWPEDEIKFMEHRGTINRVAPQKGSLLTRIVDRAPAEPAKAKQVPAIEKPMPEEDSNETFGNTDARDESHIKPKQDNAAAALAAKQQAAMAAVGASKKGR